MSSIAESLPPELLEHIFQFVQNDCRSAEEDDVSYQRHVSLRIPFFSDSRKPSRYERHEFRQFRLVSRNWKMMADSFLFGDVCISIGGAWDNNVFYSMDHRFLETMYRGRYMKLVRSVHLELTSFDDGSNTTVLWEGTRLWLFTNLICHVLRQHSCRYIRITSIMFSEYCSHRGIQHILVNRITDALQNVPRECVVEFSTRSPRSGITRPMSYEEWFMTQAPDRASKNLSSLEIGACTTAISKTFFASLRHTKRFHMSSSEKLTPRDFDDFSARINMMPALEELSADFPVSPLPKTLRRLHLTLQGHEFPPADFFTQLAQMDTLQDLRFGFFAAPPDPRRPPQPIALSSWQLSQISTPQLPNLRVLHVSTDRASRMIQGLCFGVLCFCSSLEDVKLFGVGLTNDIILGTATRSLRNLALDSALYGYGGQEIETGFQQYTEEIQWKTLCTLFQRNPGITQLRLAFSLSLAPLTYASIHTMSKLCQRLAYVEIFAELNDFVAKGILQNLRKCCGVEGIWSGGTRHQDGVIKKVINLICGIETGYSVIVDLRLFRILKTSQVLTQKLWHGSINLDLEEEIHLF